MRRLTLLSQLFLVILLVGCEDIIELEKQSYVIAIGIDQTEQEGMYQFTFQIANPISSDPAEGSGQTPDQVVSIPSTDIITATDIANDFLTKKVNLDHTLVIVVSEQLARAGDFIRVIQPATRTAKIHRNIQIIVSRENAEQFLRSIDHGLESKPNRYFQFMISRVQETGVTAFSDFHRFFQVTEGKDRLFLAMYGTTIQEQEDLKKKSIKKIAGEIVQTGGNPAQFIGSAVFKNGKMIDVLTGEETRIVNILNKTTKMDDLIAAIADPIEPNYSISGRFVKKKDPKVSVYYDANTNHAKFDILVPFDFEVLAVPSMVNYSSNGELELILLKALENYFTTTSHKFIEKTQKEYKGDPFYLSLYIRRLFKDIPSYEKADWQGEIYPNAEINVRFKIERLEFGKSIYDTNLNELSD